MIELIKSAINIPLARAQIAAANEVADQTQDQLTQLVGTVLAKIPLWITALIVIILSFVIARIVKSSVENKLVTEGFEEEHKELSIVAGRSANAIVLTIGITVGLKIAGIDLTTIIAAGAFGIGFALKDLIMNFIAGVMILSARHYTIGDIIKVKGVFGKIEEIQSRATIVKNFDGTKVVIPNSELFKNSVTSFTSNPFRRVTVLVGFTYDSNLKKAVEVCKQTAMETKNVLAEPRPRAFLYEFGDSEICGKVSVWVESKKGIIKVRNELIQNLHNAFAKHDDIEMTYPIYKIELGNEEGLVDAVKNRLEGRVRKEKVELATARLLENHLKSENATADTGHAPEKADTAVPAKETPVSDATPPVTTPPPETTMSPANTAPPVETAPSSEITTPPSAAPPPAWLQRAAAEQPSTPGVIAQPPATGETPQPAETGATAQPSASEQPATPAPAELSPPTTPTEQPSTQTAQNPQ